ncbi:MAG: fibronectin type III domain-containing protein [Firmicutes bacterium]|nr:fibronectin type III domain-containing protein [Bacillota bacterium]
MSRDVLRSKGRFSRRRIILFVNVIVAVSTLLSGCFGGPGQRISSPDPPLTGPTGGVAVKALLASTMAGDAPIGQVKAVLTRGSHILERELAVDLATMTAAGSFPKVLIGTWELEVKVYSQRGDLTYLGTASVLVQEGKTASVELPLRAAPGVLVIHLDISDFEGYEQVKGRIIIGTGEQSEVVKEFTREDSSIVTVEIDRLTPKTHDLRIELYKNTFHSYNRIYQSPWETVTIRPGQTTEVNWNPAWGCVEIIGYIDAPPPPPAHVNTLAQEDGILISWDPVVPVENDLHGYKIYVQTDPFAGFQLVAVVSSQQTSYLYLPEPSSHWEDEVVSIQVAVSSVDKGGNESIRSHPVNVEWIPTTIDRPGP